MAMRGDRFIVRDETAQRTLGGGVVIHPWARPHARREPDLESKLKTLHTGGSSTILELFLDEHDEFAIPLEPIYQFLNLCAEDALALAREVPAVRTVGFEGEELFTTHRKWAAVTETLLAALHGVSLEPSACAGARHGGTARQAALANPGAALSRVRLTGWKGRTSSLAREACSACQDTRSR